MTSGRSGGVSACGGDGGGEGEWREGWRGYGRPVISNLLFRYLKCYFIMCTVTTAPS